jgi:hypothetical protein
MANRNLVRGFISLVMLCVFVGEFIKHEDDSVHDERHQKSKVILNILGDSDKNKRMIDHITA